MALVLRYLLLVVFMTTTTWAIQPHSAHASLSEASPETSLGAIQSPKLVPIPLGHSMKVARALGPRLVVHNISEELANKSIEEERRLAESAYLEASRLVAIGAATAGIGGAVVLIGLLVMMQTGDLTGGLISILIGSITATVGMIILLVGRVARLAASIHRSALSKAPVIKSTSQVPAFARASPRARGSVLFRF
jgi:hypothetical protein